LRRHVPAFDVVQLSDLHVTAGGELHGQDPRLALDLLLAAGELLPEDQVWLPEALTLAGDHPVMVWLHHPPVAHPLAAALEQRDFGASTSTRARWPPGCRHFRFHPDGRIESAA
jgi:hypothetical protein